MTEPKQYVISIEGYSYDSTWHVYRCAKTVIPYEDGEYPLSQCDYPFPRMGGIRIQNNQLICFERAHEIMPNQSFEETIRFQNTGSHEPAYDETIRFTFRVKPKRALIQGGDSK